jgi:hypothetical protein
LIARNPAFAAHNRAFADHIPAFADHIPAFADHIPAFAGGHDFYRGHAGFAAAGGYHVVTPRFEPMPDAGRFGSFAHTGVARSFAGGGRIGGAVAGAFHGGGGGGHR